MSSSVSEDSNAGGNTANIIGYVTIFLSECSKLKNRRLNANSDLLNNPSSVLYPPKSSSEMCPFVQIELNGDVQNSRVITNGGIHPSFNQRFIFNLKTSDSSVMLDTKVKLRVYDRADFCITDLIGDTEFKMREIIDSNNIMTNSNDSNIQISIGGILANVETPSKFNEINLHSNGDSAGKVHITAIFTPIPIMETKKKKKKQIY